MSAEKNPSSKFTAIILAAGHGTRMKSPLPKVLHPVAGIPMLSRVINSVKKAGAQEVRVVIGKTNETLIRRIVEPLGVVCFLQHESKGTADAVRSAQIDDLEGDLMVINGDHPLITADDVRAAREDFKENNLALAVVTCRLKKPGAFGRIIRQGDSFTAIVEAKEASPTTLKINEVNTGLYVARADLFKKYLSKIGNQNAAKEFYLTDIVALAKSKGEKVGAIESHPRVAMGVNTQMELAQVTRKAFLRKAVEQMEKGVIIIDPRQTYIEDTVELGEGSIVYPGTYLRGKTTSQRFCAIESNCYLSNVVLGESVQVKAMSHLEDAVVHTRASVGPFARLRPGAILGEDAQIGNFVEIKNSVLGAGSKAGHLAYIGDAEVGRKTNIGCGAITVNYAVDKKKYKTVIGDNVFIGSDAQLVAPVTVNNNAFVGCGSVITKDVPAGALAVARAKTVVKLNYQPRSPEEIKETSNDSISSEN